MTWTSLENTKLRGRIQAQSRIAWFRVQGMFRTGESAETGRRSVVPPGSGWGGVGGSVQWVWGVLWGDDNVLGLEVTAAQQ